MLTPAVTQLNNRPKPKVKIPKAARLLKTKCRHSNKTQGVVHKRSNKCKLSSKPQMVATKCKTRLKLSLRQDTVALVSRCKIKRNLKWASAAFLFKIRLRLNLNQNKAEVRGSKCRAKRKLKIKLEKAPPSLRSPKLRLSNKRVPPLSKCKCKTKLNQETGNNLPRTKLRHRQPVNPIRTAVRCKCSNRNKVLMTGSTSVNATTEKFTFY